MYIGGIDTVNVQIPWMRGMFRECSDPVDNTFLRFSCILAPLVIKQLIYYSIYYIFLSLAKPVVDIVYL